MQIIIARQCVSYTNWFIMWISWKLWYCVVDQTFSWARSKDQIPSPARLLVLSCISLGLTLSWYHFPGEECKPYPSKPSYRQTPHSHHLYSSEGRYDLFHVPDIICGLGLEADSASAPFCCFRRRGAASTAVHRLKEKKSYWRGTEVVVSETIPQISTFGGCPRWLLMI